MRRAGPRRPQRGVAMVEALIAMLLIALWLLSSAGLQAGTFKYQQSAGHRFVAVSLAGELGEAIEANAAAARTGAYAMATRSTAVTAVADCSAVFCTPAQLAQFNLAQWSERVVQTLPLRDMTVASAAGAGGLVTYTITLRWDESRGRQAYATDSDVETLSVVMNKVVRDGAF